jgi:voltage-gated potassium channel
VLALILGAIFVGEYVLRLTASARRPDTRGLGAMVGGLRYARSPLGIVDLFCAIYLGPYLVVDMVPSRPLAVFVVLKLLRYTQKPDLIVTVLRNERRLLSLIGIYVFILATVSSVLIFELERRTQPEVFTSFGTAAWYVIATITTVGYGDMAPVTLLGRLLAGGMMISAIISFGFIFGAIGLGVMDEVRRRNFMVMWTLVANVPVFRRLTAIRIAQIAALLEPLSIRRGDAVVTRGDPAEEIYFIVKGEVLAIGRPGNPLLSDGDFFGEEAIAMNARRPLSAVAQSGCQLLRLRMSELRKLMSRHADLAEAVRAAPSELASVAA